MTIADQFGPLAGISVNEYGVNEYGADPTGVADSTAAFVSCAAAVNAGIAAGEPGVSFTMGDGTYLVNCSQVAFASSLVAILGNGSTRTIINAYGSGPLFQRTNSNWNNGQTNYGAPVSGFIVFCTGTGQANVCSGLKDIDVMRPWYQDLEFDNFTYPGSAGLWQHLASWWAERAMGFGLTFKNCDTGHWQDGGTSSAPSFDYSNFFGVNFSHTPGQSGRKVSGPNGGNTQLYGGSYSCIANAHSNLATALLTSALSTGGAITSLPISPTSINIASGATVTLTSGGNNQTWTTTSAVPIGSIAIPVASQTPNFAYPIGSNTSAPGAPSYVWTIGVGSSDNTSVQAHLVDITGEVDGSGSTCFDFNVGSGAGFHPVGTIILTTHLGYTLAGIVNPSPLVEVATTGPNGFALQNATPTILTWTAPNDGRMHAIYIPCTLVVATTETGGVVQVVGTGTPGIPTTQLFAAGNTGPGTYNQSSSVGVMKQVAPGQSVSVTQSTALTGGAATFYGSILAN